MRGSTRALEGDIKQKTGRMVGNRRLEAEGAVERGAGKLQRKLGKAEHLAGE